MARSSRADDQALSAASTAGLRLKCGNGWIAGGVADGSALLDRKPRHVQLRHLAQRGRDDRAGRGAGGARLAELRLELGGAPGKGGIDQPVERQGRGVGDHGHHVVELDLLLARA
jgi:hypothetical protein